MSPPTAPQAMKHVLGHITYTLKFINHLSAEAEPLRQFLKKDTNVKWGRNQAAACNKLETLRTDTETL